jgi:hypothetical protein
MLQSSRSASTSKFEHDPRRIQEIRCRPYADTIYQSVFGKDIDIQRSDLRDTGINNVLDREFAIDVQIKLNSGLVLLGQEKFLSNKYSKYASVTVEYYQNQFTKELGDWFKMGVQFYFTGYEINSKLHPYIILDWPQTVLATDAGLIIWAHNSNKDGYAKASFVHYPMANFPSSCVIARSFQY